MEHDFKKENDTRAASILSKGFAEVTKAEFYKWIGSSDVVYSAVGQWPFNGEWTERRDRRLVGMSMSQRCESGLPDRYFIKGERPKQL